MQPTDKEILDWIDENVDDLTTFRSISEPLRINITFCSKETGCQCEAWGSSIRQVVTESIDKELKK